MKMKWINQEEAEKYFPSKRNSFEWISQEIKDCTSCYTSESPLHFEICSDHEKKFMNDLNRKPRSDWISIEEKLPPLDGQYLVFISYIRDGNIYKRIKVARFNKSTNHKISHFYGNQTFKTKDITHWMPLPSAPNIGPSDS